MPKFTFTDANPPNLDELSKNVEDMTTWKGRLAAVEELGKWRSKETVHLLYRRMVHDPVFPVKEQAFRTLQAFGEDVRLTKAKKGKLVKNIDGQLQAALKAAAGSDLATVKTKFREMYPESYDLYDFQHGSGFDEWLARKLSLPGESRA